MKIGRAWHGWQREYAGQAPNETCKIGAELNRSSGNPSPEQRRQLHQ